MTIEANTTYQVGEAAHDLSHRSDPVLRALGQHLWSVRGVLDLVRKLDESREEAETVRQAVWLLLPPGTMAESLVSDARELAALLGRVVSIEDALKEAPHE